MKFSKTHLTVVGILSLIALLYAGSAWADVMNPERQRLAELQNKRAQNERLIADLKEEHEKTEKVRDDIATKLDELNNQLLKIEEKGRLARAANDDLTEKIENGGK